MSRGRELLAKASGFAGATLITGVVNAAAIPALISAGGIRAWTDIAVGQSIGAIGAVAIGFGWAVSGAATVAVGSASAAADALRRSIAIRGMLAVPVLVIAAFAGYVAVIGGSWTAAASAAAYSLNGMTAAWWFVGTRSPRGMILRETLPKAAGVVIGVLLVTLTQELLWFPLALATGCLSASVFALRGLEGTRWIRRADVAGFRTELRTQAPAAVTSAVSTAYLNVPLIVVSALAPHQLGAFAITDRLFRLANVGVSPLVQTLQGWIPHSEPVELRRRIRRGLKVAAALGALTSLTFALLSTFAGPLLSAGAVAIDPGTVLAFGVTLFFVVISQICGLSCLVSLGRVSDVARSAVLGAIIGVPVVVLGALAIGAPGAAIGEATAEGAVTAYQLLRVRALLRQASRPRTTGKTLPPGASGRKNP